MGKPNWAQASNGRPGPRPFDSNYAASGANGNTGFSRVQFPVHKIENSPVLSSYQDKSSNDVFMDQRSAASIPFPHSNNLGLVTPPPSPEDQGQIKGHGQGQMTLVAPDEVLFKVKREYFKTDDELGQPKSQANKGQTQKHNLGAIQKGQIDEEELWRSGNLHKMVDLEAVNAVKEIEVEDRVKRGRDLIPTSTKVMEEKPKTWYAKFSRNIHGLRKDMPYNNLEWPPRNY